MQGLDAFIPTEVKVEYLNLLLRVGFDTLDFGSFVSPKAIPQMRDTAEVVKQLELGTSSTRLLAIVANQRGAEAASAFDEITYLGYPFSISETFQRRNTNASIAQSLSRVEVIQAICEKYQKEMVLYISMGFGNPYGDEWHVDIVQYWVEKLAQLGIKIFQLSDTVGLAKSDSISYLFSHLIPENPELEIGAHFHTTHDSWLAKVEAAFEHGCRRFDGAIKGFGGCPMAQNELVGNMPSENLIEFAESKGIDLSFDMERYQAAVNKAVEIMH